MREVLLKIEENQRRSNQPHGNWMLVQYPVSLLKLGAARNVLEKLGQIGLIEEICERGPFED